MKKNDIAAVVLIVMLATVISFIVASTVVGTPQNDPVQVEEVTPIQEGFPAPDSRVFSKDAIDPTVDIKGGSGNSSQPFAN